MVAILCSTKICSICLLLLINRFVAGNVVAGMSDYIPSEFRPAPGLFRSVRLVRNRNNGILIANEHETALILYCNNAGRKADDAPVRLSF